LKRMSIVSTIHVTLLESGYTTSLCALAGPDSFIKIVHAVQPPATSTSVMLRTFASLR
jgi:hypothetical protein